MFSNIKISRRLIILITALTLIFVTTGVLSLSGMTDLGEEVGVLNDKTAESARFAKIAGDVRYHLVDVSQQLASGGLTWQEAAHHLRMGAKEFDQLWLEHETRIAGDAAAEEFFNDTFGI